VDPKKINKISIVRIVILQIWSTLPIQEIDYDSANILAQTRVISTDILSGLIGFAYVHILNRPTASRLRPDYLADFLHEQIWRTFYIVVLPDFLAYYFPRFRVQKDILSYLNIINWPSFTQKQHDSKCK
jgi:hypothetical protein